MPNAPADSDLLAHIETVRIDEAVTRDVALRALANAALAAGWAKPGYDQALLTREAAYPTGLHTRGIEIAIPHADAEWTLVPSLVVGILKSPVIFQPMGGQGGDVSVKIILLLVIPDADAHIEFLRAISGFIENESLLNELGETEDPNLLIDYLRETLETQIP